jgi:hypothetical protein
LKGGLETLCQTPGKASQITYMDHWLKEVEKLLLDNALLKVQNQALFNIKKSKMEGMVANCIGDYERTDPR